ncbi:hypothetical protein OHS70_05050 [Streptomyces sp. NBC_00390]|uniref:hypothetical protein n=1 Tax=Streptomyces sp. NBC_00390 TaxID=2975736 RepID=UPI002E1E2205
MAVMRQLRQWADVSYRELERRAGAVGDVLPRATLSGALSRQELPREELLAAFVRACGGDEATVEDWVKVRKRLAVELEQHSSALMPAAEEPSAAQSLQGDPDPRSGSEEVTPDGADHHGEVADADASGEAVESETPAARTEAVAGAPHPLGVEGSRVAEPVADADAVSPAADLVQEGSSVALPAMNPVRAGPRAALRVLRRPGVVITAAVAIVLLTASATGILRSGGDQDEPQVGRSGAPAATDSPSSTPRPPGDGAASSAAVTKPVKDKPAPGGTREVSPSVPSKKTTVPRDPEPERSSWTPEPEPYEPPPAPYEPPSSTSTPPPGGGGDPFPEETCWDVTNDCL